ncbi:MAG TPA: GntR family transcriptional regulator [Alphaproteobacteria bacterium]|nr:GntR family transcriptional regulator [Alphaproteobacteria bacterium]
MPLDPPTTFRTKREIAIATLRDAIRSGRYPPGQALRQTQLMADLGLGATPVREAVLELLARGMLVQESHHSVRVADLDLARIRHIFQVRALLETEAARLGALNAAPAELRALRDFFNRMQQAKRAGDMQAAGEADGAFHRALYKAAGNEVLMGLIEQLWESFPRYLLWAIPGRIEGSLREHRAILAAVVARDAEDAAAAMNRHLMSSLSVLEAYVAQFPRAPLTPSPRQD